MHAHEKSMTKFFKFVYTMIILLFVFFVAIEAYDQNCTSDCSSSPCLPYEKPECLKGECLCMYTN
ncbi:unnamed protein product [Trifolium pratense]|uniref:Uncharacterized protein n=1 Tax=Trifolium pratense TaxID=57577 RepID=A0ACB0LP48_TRIPR|nr:unnamed protein product [Trifolium pratense]